MDVKLVMFKSDGQRREFELSNPETTIGRAAECDLRIPLASVSRRHCLITIEEDAVNIRDLGSSNGTFVNNRRIQESPLNPGDVLVLGPVIFTTVIDGQPQRIKPIPTVVGDQSIEPVVALQHEGHTV